MTRQKPQPSRVIKVNWPGSLSERVILRGRVYPTNPDQEQDRPRSACYDYVDKTGDPEKDRWRGRSHDHTAPIFLRMRARKQWDRHVRALNRLLEENEIKPGQKCDCKD